MLSLSQNSSSLVEHSFGALNMTNPSADEQRFARLHVDQMTDEQKIYFNSLMAGPISGTGSKGVVQGATSLGAPFNVLLRSPVLAERMRKVGEYLRFESTIPKRLNELAILITARTWTAQYEWYAHLRLALKEGLDPLVGEELAKGQRPSKMKPDEEAVYDFCHELHTRHSVSDSNYNAVLKLFGEQGVVDLMMVSGYYVMVAMALNVNRSPLPEGAIPIPEL
jgi:4-carboxymuconolactone decarboxylase